MKSVGLVTKYVHDLVAKQVENHSLVVWYDPDGAYVLALLALNLATIY